MKLTNFYREEWRGLGDWSLTTLDNIVASLQGAWAREHKADDSHGHIHSDSLQVGRIVFNNILTSAILEGTTVNNFNDPLLKDAGLWRISITGTTTDVTITGIQIPQDENNAALDGRMLVIENIDGNRDIILTHLSAGSNATAQFFLPYTASVAIHPHEFLVLIYNLGLSKWIVHKTGSQWQGITYNAGDFTAATGTWGVDSGDITTQAFHVEGDKMTVSVDIRNTDVSNITAELRIPIPLGRTATRGMRNLIQVIDAGAAAAVGIMAVNAGQTLIRFFSTIAGGGWAVTAADNTAVIGQITFGIDA